VEGELSERGKQLLRLGAAVWQKTDAEFIEMAAAEFLHTHKHTVDARIEEARKQLLGFDVQDFVDRNFRLKEDDGPET
jgi:hypothetical protein